MYILCINRGEIYYGYKNGVNKWKRLQRESRFPLLLSRYFDWVQDGALVDTAQSQNLLPIARMDTRNQWQFNPQERMADNNRTTLVSPQGDFTPDDVLRASMLPGKQDKPPISDRDMKNILVVGHERSGTHFLINTIALNYPYYSNYEISVLGDTQELRQIFEWYYSKNERRIFKSHHQFYFFFPFFEELLRHFHIFYIVRDGRDVLTSCFHYYNNFPEGKGVIRE